MISFYKRHEKLTGLILIFFILVFSALLILNYLPGQIPAFAADSQDDCEGEPPPEDDDGDSGEPTFIQASRRILTNANYEKPKLELSNNSSNTVLIAYEKSLITTSPEIQIVSSLPDWLTITGLANYVDLGDDNLDFVETTFTVADGTIPNSTTEVELDLIDSGTQEVKSAKKLVVTIDRNLFAQISIPYNGCLVRAHVPIFGLAYGENFSSYTVEYGAGYEPDIWTTIETSTTPQTKDTSPTEFVSTVYTIYGNLTTWETGLTEYEYGYWSVDLNGIYTIRLKVTNTSEQIVIDEKVVQVGRVMGAIFSGIATSPDEKVTLHVQEQSIKDDFEIIGINTILNESIPVEPGHNLIGQIYELQPPGLEFTKSATLEMYYTDTDLGGGDENKLCIYTYNPNTGHWDYISSAIDAVNNKLTAPIFKITSQYAYYAIFEKTNLPTKPVLNQPPSPTQEKLILLSGTSGPNLFIELYVNSFLKAETTATSVGTFSLQNLPLTDGTNTITAKAIDQFGQISPESDPAIVEVSEPTLTVNSLKFKTADYSADFTGTVDLGNSLYIQIDGTDPDPNTNDKTSISLISSQTDPQGIELQLEETTATSGIFRGQAQIGTSSSQSHKTIAAYQDSETITATSLINGSKFDTVTLSDGIPPLAPAITSSTHSSVCQDTFEDGFNEWSNRDGEVGATLSFNNTVTQDSTNALELVNLQYGGNFASNARITSFDASQYPLVTFDYKITENIKINFLVKVDDKWHDIVFTDEPKQYWQLNMKKIGELDNITKDDLWHSASFNLCEMLKTKTDQTLVQEMIMADWDDFGYMSLLYGTNPAYATYYLDNFLITKAGYSNKNPEFIITPPSDPSGIAEYSYTLDQLKDTLPDTITEGSQTTISYSDLADGPWYFHIRAKDGADNWGPANHYRVFIDTQGPTADTPTPSPYTNSGNPTIMVHLTDSTGCGVNPETIKLKVEEQEYELTNPALTYDKQTEILTFVPSNIGVVFPDNHVVNVELTQASDYAGNVLQDYLSWEWNVDYSLDTTPPDAPVVASYLITGEEHNQINISWHAIDANGIAGYSFILNQESTTIPDTISEGLVTSKIYNDLDSSWYLHVRAQDRAGNWGAITHYQINVEQYPFVLIDDFDDGNLQNPYGWTYSWSGNGATASADPYNSDPNNVYGQDGYSLKFTYDVPSAAWAGFTTEARTDVSGCNYLTFWVKGSSGGEKLNIGLRDCGPNGIPDDSDDNEAKLWIMNYLPDGITTSWQKISIPLSSFVDVHYLNTLNNFTIVVEDPYPGTGTVYIENIQFEQHPGLLVEDFNDGSLANPYGWSYAWQGPSATSQIYIYNTDLNNVYGNCGSSLEFNYNVPSDSWAGFTTEARTDVSGCNYLTFWVKGSSGGEKLNIGLRDCGADGVADNGDDNETKLWINDYLSGGAATYWQKIEIPFSDFTNIVYWNTLNNFTIVVEDPYPGTGTVYIENIQFEYQSAPALLDNFDDGDLNNEYGWSYAWSGNDGAASVNAYNTDLNNVYGQSGYSLEFSYDVPSGGYGGFTTDLKDDISIFNAVSFWVKGASGGEKLEVGLKDSFGNETNVWIMAYLNGGVTTFWRNVIIPLSAFSDIQFNSMENFTIVVEDPYPGTGTVYIDEIKFINVEYILVPTLDAIPALTNQSSLAISGQATPGAEIVPFVEVTGEVVTEQNHIFADADGNFSGTVNLYVNKSNQIYAYAKDNLGNASLNSSSQIVYYDSLAPQTPTINSIESPRRNPNIEVSGSAESGTTVHLVIAQPNSGDVEYTQETVAGAYIFNLTLDDGDGTYLLTAQSQDDAGNWSAESSPVEVILDAVSDPPSVSLESPKAKDIWGYGEYEVEWQAVDSDPTDTITDITLKYSKPATDHILVDNFNSQSSSNNLGGLTDTGSANGAIITASFVADANAIYDNTGASLELTYDVTPTDSHADYWSSLVPQPDMSAYQYLTMEIKGAVGGELFKIGLKDAFTNETKLLITNYLSSGVTTEWQKIAIPLVDFSGVDSTNLENVSIAFENWIPSDSGTIYVDEIRFYKWQNLTTGEANDGVYEWNTTGSPESDRYLLKTVATDDRGQQGEGEIKDYFAISGFFFDNFDGQDVVEGWWDSDGTTVYQRSFDVTTYYEGGCSMKVVYDKTGYPWSFFAGYPVHDGVKNNFTSYNQFIFFIKGNASIQIRFEDTQAGSWEQTQSTQTPEGDDWEKLTYDFSGATGIDLADIDNVMFFVAPGDGNASGTIWIDAIYLSTNYTNLALGKTATASAEYSIDYPASKVIDGQINEDTNTYWLLPDAATGWVEVNLSTVYNVNKIKWLNTHNGANNDRAATSWHIEISEDGINYTQVGSGTESFSSEPEWVEIYFATSKAQYVKFHVDGYYNLGGGINELQVWGY